MKHAFSCTLGMVCLLSFILLAHGVHAQSSVIKSTKAILDVPAIRSNNAINTNRPIQQDDSKLEHYDIALCAEYLSLQFNSRYAFQPSVGIDGRKVAPADFDQINVLSNQTVLQIQPNPAQQRKTTKTTTVTNSATTAITTKSQNTATVAVATPIVVALDHRTGLLTINGQIASAFEKRQQQEACLNAIQQ